LKPKQAFFAQGGRADSIFYLQRGRAKQTVVSKNGKEATIALFAIGDFIGQESLATLGGCAWPQSLPSPPPGASLRQVVLNRPDHEAAFGVARICSVICRAK
jgi:CRP-like cAMP-binding protein